MSFYFACIDMYTNKLQFSPTLLSDTRDMRKIRNAGVQQNTTAEGYNGLNISVNII